jgi:hypothetical protein
MVIYPGLNRTEFRTEHLFVHHPGNVEVQRLALPTGLLLTPSGGFDPKRPVVNLKVVDPTTNQPVTVFIPAIVLQVRYDSGDINSAGGEQNLRLGYWDGTSWNLFTIANNDFHLIHDQTSKFVGWGVVTIREWSDPTIGWGK